MPVNWGDEDRAAGEGKIDFSLHLICITLKRTTPLPDHTLKF